MIDKHYLSGKKVADLVNGRTKFPTYDARWPEMVDEINEVELDGYIQTKVSGDYCVAIEWSNNLVMCFDKDVLVAAWTVYELHDVEIFPQKNMFVAHGHETICIYFFDDGYFREITTR